MTTQVIALTPEGSKFRLPSTPQIVEVTPEMASDWVSYRRHPDLRPLSAATSARYQADMEARPPRWRQATPEGLIFDTDGWIISAQHRLKAQANAGVTLKWWIYPNESRDIGPYLEQGRRRTVADLLRVRYATQVGSAARHLAALEDGDDWGMPRYNKITVTETVATYHDWPELTWYLTEATAAQYEANIPSGPHMAVLAQAARTEHRDRIPEWLEGVRKGFNLAEGDPRAHLRQRFRHGILQTKGKVNKRDMTYALLVKAWNAYVLGESMQVLVHRVTEYLPEVEGFVFVSHLEGTEAA